MTKTVYLLCGVSGAGKTWVCEQLKDKFTYVPHDKYYDSICEAITHFSMENENPVITECPFGERILRDSLERLSFTVIPVFIIETQDIVASRYFLREGKPIQKSAHTRAISIIARAQEWGAPFGTSTEILQYLKGV